MRKEYEERTEKRGIGEGGERSREKYEREDKGQREGKR